MKDTPYRRSVGLNINGTFPALKANYAPYKSTIERDCIHVLEFDPWVLRYVVQPFTIHGPGEDGKMHQYTPDIEVIRTTDRGLIECKPASEIKDDHTKQQCTLGKNWAATHEHWFSLVTDVQLRSGHVLNNIKLLRRYARLPVPPALSMQCVEYLASYPKGIPLLDLATVLIQGKGAPLTQTPILYTLLYRHVLAADLTQPLSHTTQIWLSTLETLWKGDFYGPHSL